MARQDRSMRSALGKVRNHGASGEGTGHFIAQRISAIALAILAPWFVVSAGLSMRDGSYLSAIDFLADPVTAVGVILLTIVALYHMSLGMQEVINDYIVKPSTKMLLLLLNMFAPLALGAGALFAMLQLNFGV